MPYEGEFAMHRSIQRLANSPLVQGLRRRCKVAPERTQEAAAARSSELEIPRPAWLPDWIIAIDGSHSEIPIRNGFPGAEAAYLSVASVMLNVKKMRVLDQARPVDPAEFNRLKDVDAIDCVLPGCNVVIDDDLSAEQSLRTQIYEIFSSTRLVEDGESLLDTYEALLAYKPTSREQSCPYEDCRAQQSVYDRRNGRYRCGCELARPLFSTDALRIHEGMNPAGSNGAMYAEISQVLEHIWLIHILRTIEQRKWLSSLRRLAFLVDGALAVFGHPAWLSEAIVKELNRINDAAFAVNKTDILLLGVEKSGPFLDHLLQLDLGPRSEPNRLPNGFVMLINDQYIKSNIVFSDSKKPYGSQTYYGRKFFYKTRGGARIVGVSPFLHEGDDDLDRAELSQYRRLADSLNILDELVSVRYPDAIVPIIAAHAEAAIPMRAGRRVLEQITRELVETD